jgi:hypothetical protein
MLECLVLGDSIAVGTAQHRPECVALAAQSLTSAAWNRRFAGVRLEARTAVISLGTNDSSGVESEAELRVLRERLVADRVFWIVPTAGNSVRAVAKLAVQHGDSLVLVRHFAPDLVHPRGDGYRRLAELTRKPVHRGVRIVDERIPSR